MPAAAVGTWKLRDAILPAKSGTPCRKLDALAAKSGDIADFGR